MSQSRAAHHTDRARVAGVSLSHPARQVYSDLGMSKRELAEYYRDIAEHMLPSVEGRPLTIVRCPRGQGGQCFFQKHFDDTSLVGLEGVDVEESPASAATPPRWASRASSNRCSSARSRFTHGLRGPKQARLPRSNDPRSRSRNRCNGRVFATRLARCASASGGAGCRASCARRAARGCMWWCRSTPCTLGKRSAHLRTRLPTRCSRIRRTRSSRPPTSTPAPARSTSTTCATRAARPPLRTIRRDRSAGRRLRCRSRGEELARVTGADHYRLAGIRRRVAQLERPAWPDFGKFKQRLTTGNS